MNYILEAEKERVYSKNFVEIKDGDKSVKAAFLDTPEYTGIKKLIDGATGARETGYFIFISEGFRYVLPYIVACEILYFTNRILKHNEETSFIFSKTYESEGMNTKIPEEVQYSEGLDFNENKGKYIFSALMDLATTVKNLVEMTDEELAAEDYSPWHIKIFRDFYK